MGKFKDNFMAFLPLLVLLSIGIPLTIKELKEQGIEKAERKHQRALEEHVEYFRQPMVWNGDSFQIGYLLKDAFIYVDEVEDEITYSLDYETHEEGLRVFDSLFVEICKFHCDSLAPHRFTNKYNRVFECSHTGASLTLRYRGRQFEIKGEDVTRSEVEITYKVPQKLGHGVGEEWQQYLVVD